MLVLKKYLARYRFRDILTVLVEEYGGFFLRNFPGYEGILLRHLLYRCTFKSLGRGSTIHTNVRINHSYKITAGQYLNINWGTLIDGRGGIEIGDYALIGPGVYIGSTNHIVNPTRGEPRALQNHTDRPVRIGSNTWIGANCMAAAVELMKANPLSELIWASPRELLNIFQADAVGCHIITVTNSILKKLALLGYDLDEYSLDTVKMFYNDATAAGYKI